MPLVYTSFFGGGEGIPPPSADAWELVEHKAAPVAGVFDFTSLDLSAYQDAALVLEALRLDTDGGDLHMQFYIGGVLQTSGYRRRYRFVTSDDVTGDSNSVSDAGVLLSDDLQTDANFGFSALVQIGNAAESLHKNVMFEAVDVDAGGDLRRYAGGGLLEETGTLDGIYVEALSTATIDSGTATLFGLKKS